MSPVGKGHRESSTAPRRTTGHGTRERGSVVLFVLFVCLAVAVVVQTLSVIVLCADRSLAAEDSGRALMKEKDQALATLRQRVLAEWRPMPWSAIQQTPLVEVAVAELPDSGGWALGVSARHSPDVSPIVVSAWLERGRDGLDLPLAGLVAATATWTSGRAEPWLEVDGGGMADAEGTRDTAAPVARFQTVPAAPVVGSGVIVGSMASAWRLDDGWLSFFAGLAAERSEPAAGQTEAVAAEGVAAGARVSTMRGEPETTFQLSQGSGASPEAPALLVVCGGASLDAGGRADVYGVIVVNEGGVLLDGTRLHGALFATGTVDFGTDGVVVFSRSTLRWATDRSLNRARLVPGTRQETLS